MQNSSGKAAFDALTTAVMGHAAQNDSAPLLTAEQRSALIAFAEANIRRTETVRGSLNRAALGRVQAQYVAGSLATLDGSRTKSPFHDPELTQVYHAQQRYMAALTDSSAA